MTTTLLFILSLITLQPSVDISKNLHGAWKSDSGVVIFSGNYFSYADFTKTEFQYTYGGTWEIDGNKLVLTYEFDTKTPDRVGSSEGVNLLINGKSMDFDGNKFSLIDHGKPGKLNGAWLFSNRYRDGKLGTPRDVSSPRKTLKILSGTRFQWVAYNKDTKEFMGTGGGTYTTKGGKYTENIDFFSKDNSRVGASLEFDFSIEGNEWNHKGLSSKGDPIHEVWSLQE